VRTHPRPGIHTWEYCACAGKLAKAVIVPTANIVNLMTCFIFSSVNCRAALRPTRASNSTLESGFLLFRIAIAPAFGQDPPVLPTRGLVFSLGKTFGSAILSFEVVRRWRLKSAAPASRR